MSNENLGEAFRLSFRQRIARDSIRAKLLSGEYETVYKSCPMCGVADGYVLSMVDAYGLPMRTLLCPECDLIYSSPRLAEDSLTAMYADEYRSLDRVLPDVGSYFEMEMTKGERIYNFLSDSHLLNRIEGKFIVEIGCGAGGGLHFFEKYGYEVIGCDLVSEHLKYGVNEYDLDLHYGKLQDLLNCMGDKRSSIGLVIFEQVFEHLSDPRGELQRLRELLPVDALVYIGVPGVRNIDEQYESNFVRFLQLPHLVHYDLKRLELIASSCGFRLINGDETARAVFDIAAVRLQPWLGCKKNTAIFLYELSLRYKKRKFRLKLRRFPLDVGMTVADWVDSSRLPASVKLLIVTLMKKIHSWLRASPLKF